MKFQIIGCSKLTRETKNGKHFRILTIMNPNPGSDFDGIDAEKLVLWDRNLEVTSIETVNGKFYDSKDNHDYFIDIEYDRHGYFNSARVYTG